MTLKELLEQLGTQLEWAGNGPLTAAARAARRADAPAIDALCQPGVALEVPV